MEAIGLVRHWCRSSGSSAERASYGSIPICKWLLEVRDGLNMMTDDKLEKTVR